MAAIALLVASPGASEPSSARGREREQRLFIGAHDRRAGRGGRRGRARRRSSHPARSREKRHRPAGWTLVRSDVATSGATLSQALYYRVASAAVASPIAGSSRSRLRTEVQSSRTRASTRARRSSPTAGKFRRARESHRPVHHHIRCRRAPDRLLRTNGTNDITGAPGGMETIRPSRHRRGRPESPRRRLRPGRGRLNGRPRGGDTRHELEQHRPAPGSAARALEWDASKRAPSPPTPTPTPTPPRPRRRPQPRRRPRRRPRPPPLLLRRPAAVQPGPHSLPLRPRPGRRSTCPRRARI